MPTLVIALGLLVLTGIGEGLFVAGEDGDAPVAASSGGKGFAVKGKVAGLYPGAGKPMTVVVTNRNSFAIRVTLLKAKARTSTQGCPPGSIKLGKFPGPLKIGAKAKRQLVWPVQMMASTPNACQGARFVLTFSGKAVRA
jgi:hypothetical protein